MFAFSVARTLILVTWLPILLATNHIDIALQKRQNNVPLGTGVTTSAAGPTSNTPAGNSAAASTSAAPSAALSTTPPAAAANSDSTNVPTAQSSNTVGSSQVSSSDSVSRTASTPASDSSESRSSTSSDPSFEVISTRSDSSIIIASKSVISSSQRVTSIVVVTSGSSTFSQTSTFDSLVAVSTSTTSTTAAPSLLQGDHDKNDSGVTSSQKRIIIGVVVGIGGAIILGGLAVVAWRIWGRKRNVGDDDNDLMGSHPGSSGHEKTSSVSGNTPFKSTLDQYHSPHSPPGPVNTASNF